MTRNMEIRVFRRRLRAIEKEIRKLQKQQARCSDKDRVSAAGKLAVLMERKKAVTGRIECLMSSEDSTWRRIGSNIMDTVGGTMRDVARWIDVH